MDDKVSARPKLTLTPQYYDMSKRKLAIIFNHVKFDFNRTERIGSTEDGQRLETCFKSLHFETKHHHDLKTDQILKIMSDVKDEKDLSCLIVVLMTHGHDGGDVCAKDGTYSVNLLWNNLIGYLVGIPKLFFIQACRGKDVDDGYDVADSIISKTQLPQINKPFMADFLHMYSTREGKTAWRESNGTWFITSLCEVLSEEIDNYDLLQLLTYVNKKVAVEYESKSKSRNEDRKKQMPQITSMLTKSLKFHKKI